MEKHTLVTGAGDYISRHVVSVLLGLRQRVSVVDRRTEGIDPKTEIVAADISGRDESVYRKLGCPGIVVHTAWRDGFRHNSPAHIDDLAKHIHFIENLYQGGLKQLIVMGTIHGVGYWGGVVGENSPCNPQSLYGISRNTLRQFTFLATKQSRAILQWVRVYYIISSDLRGDSIFSKTTRAALEGKIRFPFITGRNHYDFVSVSELAHQIALAASQTAVDGIISTCSSQPQTLAQRMEAYIKENGYHISLDYGAFPDRLYDSPGVWGDYHRFDLVLEAESGY